MSRISGSSLAREAIMAAQRRAQPAKSADVDGMARAQKTVDEAFNRVQDALESRLGSGLEGSLTSTANSSGAVPAVGSSGNSSVMDAVRSVDRNVRAADPDTLAENLITGEVRDIHEVVAIVKQAELSQRFALEVRNKLIDAYREVMRMGV